jgi:hypothetical protein
VSEVVEFPSGARRPASEHRPAQLVYEELRGLAAELAEITGHPVSITASGALDPTTEPRRRS